MLYDLQIISVIARSGPMCANLVVEIYVIEGRVYDGLNKLKW